MFPSRGNITLPRPIQSRPVVPCQTLDIVLCLISNTAQEVDKKQGNPESVRWDRLADDLQKTALLRRELEASLEAKASVPFQPLLYPGNTFFFYIIFIA